MSSIRHKLVAAAYDKAFELTDYEKYNNQDERHKFRQNTILADTSLTEDEKSKVIKLLKKTYDYRNIIYDKGTKRICESCREECLATLYCENCIRNYLKAKFSNWTSKNNEIDDLIQKCQMESLGPDMIVEWIPYRKLQKIKYLTKGGISEIYSAVWNNGYYVEWDSKKQRLKRHGAKSVILKRLVDVESANRSWFEEAKSHLTISNKWNAILKCYGLTQNPNGDYMLVMRKLDINLTDYLRQNHVQLTWKERIKIANNIIGALIKIHKEHEIHRDLHSRNILYSKRYNHWHIGDFGFCGPANKPITSIYGNLPYVAPEVIAGREYTFASDIYSVAMLMWEISSGQPPFVNYKVNYEHDTFDFAMKIVNGMRPKIVQGTPLKYKELMEQCWDADHEKRPDIDTLCNRINAINKSFQDIPNESNNNNLEVFETSSLEVSYTSNNSFQSDIYQFENLPEPRNATEEEQEEFESFNIPENICDWTK